MATLNSVELLVKPTINESLNSLPSLTSTYYYSFEKIDGLASNGYSLDSNLDNIAGLNVYWLSPCPLSVIRCDRIHFDNENKFNIELIIWQYFFSKRYSICVGLAVHSVDVESISVILGLTAVNINYLPVILEWFYNAFKIHRFCPVFHFSRIKMSTFHCVAYYSSTTVKLKIRKGVPLTEWGV